MQEISGRNVLVRRRSPWLAVGLIGIALGLSGCAAPAPVAATDIAVGSYPGSLEVSVDDADGVQVVVRQVTIQPGAGTGEHCHHGQLVGVVRQGVLTHHAPIYPSGVHQYVVGDAIVEGAGYIHEGVNEGTEPVILDVTYIIEQGEPLSETDLTRCDAQ